MAATPGDLFQPVHLSRGTRILIVAALWAGCLAAGAQRFDRARSMFAIPTSASPDEQRPGGNHGHAEMDFGSQWVMGRMIVEGHGRELYHRNRQWEVVWRGFPVELEPPAVRRNVFPAHAREARYREEEVRHDAEALMNWFMGDDSPRWREVGPAVALPFAADAICPNPFAAAALQAVARDRVTPRLIEELNRPALGGPLYPPVHGLLYAPLGLEDDPRQAYLAFQVLTVLLTAVAGLGIKVLTRGRVWWSFATFVLLLYPGYRSGLDLGQNHIISLAILAWGWGLAVRGRDTLGGVVWGLLAFKPVWAATFLVVPLLMGRWRICLGMLGSAGVLILATLPVVGLQTWFDWLAVGREGADLYDVNYRWVILSRDLSGLVHRALLDFSVPEVNRRSPLADRLGLGLWLFVFVSTVAVYWRRGDRRHPTGLATGFLFLGAYLSCYRFMYYDAVLSIVPLALLLTADRPAATGRQLFGRWNVVPLVFGAWLVLFENWIMTFGTEATFHFTGFATTSPGPDGAMVMDSPELVISTSVFYAWDTFALLALWVWAGVRVALGRERFSP